MKIKIISIILIMFFICSIASAEGVNFSGEDFSREIAFLKLVGINGTWESEFTVNRSEFISSVSELILLSPQMELNNPFSDLPENHKYYNIILTAASAGFVRGDLSGRVYPDHKISQADGIKIILSALGYDSYAMAKGGYPYGYLAVANELGMLKDLQFGANGWLTEQQCGRLLYNALHAPAAEAVTYGRDVQYRISKDNTVLKKYYKISKARGRVLGTHQLKLSNKFLIGESEVLIGEQLYEKGTFNWKDLIGHEVDFYFREINYEKLEIVSVIQRSKEITFSIEDIVQTDGGTIYYSDQNDKKQSIIIGMETFAMFNYQPADRYNPDDFQNKEGRVRVIEGSSDSTAAVVFFEVERHLVVLGVDTEAGVIYDKYSPENMLLVGYRNGVEITSFQDEYKNDVSLEDVQPNDIITVFESMDKRKVHLLRSNSEIKGTVQSVEDNDNVIVIDGDAYKTTGEFRKNATLKPGDFGLFQLTAGKKIAAIQYRKGDIRLGYLINGLEKSGAQKYVMLRILDEDGSIDDFRLASSVHVDGITVLGDKKMTPRNALDYLSDSTGVIPQLISYRLNGTGDIVMIDTSETTKFEENDSLTIGLSGSDMKYISQSLTFAAKIPVRHNTPIFLVSPRGSTGDWNYFRAYRAHNILKHNEIYSSVTAYKLGSQGLVSDAIVMPLKLENQTIRYNTPASIVTKISRKLAENGDETYGLQVYTNNAMQTLETNSKQVLDEIRKADASIHILKPGDVIRFELNEDKKISTIELVYDVENDKMNSANPSTTYFDLAYRVLKGFAYSMADGYLLITTEETITEGMDISQMEVHLVSLYPIYVYDSSGNAQKEKVIRGSYSDIQDYERFGKASKVFLHTTYGTPGMIYVIR